MKNQNTLALPYNHQKKTTLRASDKGLGQTPFNPQKELRKAQFSAYLNFLKEPVPRIEFYVSQILLALLSMGLFGLMGYLLMVHSH